MTIIIDLNAVCVVCLDNKDQLRSIFDADEEAPFATIAKKISDCSELRIDGANFRYPDKICEGCLNDLEAVERFKRNCNAANSVFRMIEEQELDETDTIGTVFAEFEQQLKDQKIKLPNGLKIKRVQPGEEEWSNEVAETAETEGTSTGDPESADENKLEKMDMFTDDGMGYEFFEAEDMGETNDISPLVAENTNNEADALVPPQVVLEQKKVQAKEEKIPVKHTPAKLNLKEETVSDDEAPLIDIREPPKRIGFYGLKNRRSKRARPEENVKSTRNKKPEEVKKAKPAFKKRAPAKPRTKAPKVKTDVKTSKGRPGKICEQCGNVYKFQHALDAHMRRHNNERPFACEFCDKAFVSNVELRRHMRVHTGHKPYACQHCTRRFSDYGSRIKHERTHTGERPYCCVTCNKSFAYAHVLTVHLLTHTGEKKFKCTLCTKGFTKKTYLQTHMDQHERDANQELNEEDENRAAEMEMKTAALQDAYNFASEYVINEFERVDGEHNLVEPKNEYIIDDYDGEVDKQLMYEVESIDDPMTEEHLEEIEANEYVLGLC